jgi:long-subunit fatty acid transport protein
MARFKCLWGAACVTAMVFAADEAAALDGQSVGMGNTGTAYVANGAAMYFNPALLHQTQTLGATLAVAPISAVLDTPITGPNTQFSSSGSPFPLFLAGVNYRLADRVVLGLAAYPVAGFGANYSKVLNGQDATLTAFAIEISPGASFAITKDLAVGVAYRVTYTGLQTGAPLLSTYENQSVSGTNFLGAQLGVFYRPVAPLRLGFSYRSKISTDLSGTTQFNGMSMPTSSSIAWPHMFRLGAALSLLDDRLLVAVDGSYAMFSDSTQQLVIVQQYASGPQSTTTPLDWIDSFGVGVGVEYRVVPQVPARVGYTVGRSNTGENAASYFFVPPGVAQTFHAGAGLRLDRWAFDLGAYYESQARDVPNDQIANPGRYAVRGVAASLSATFHIEREERP